MKVLNLQCSHQHSFEGWFASEDAFQAQLSQGQIECPMCADRGIVKMPSAPRLNLGGRDLAVKGADTETPGNAAGSSSLTDSGKPSAQPQANTLPALPDGDGPYPRRPPSLAEQAAFLKAMRHVMSHTEDVGRQFANEARAMHYGDAETRSIRGQASPREAIELLEEGIDVMPLLLPDAVKETLQ